MKPSSAADRDYFRVQSSVIIRYCLIGDRVPAGRLPESYFGEDQEFNLIRELRRIDAESSSLLHSITENDRSLGNYLVQQNKKLELIARQVVSLSPQANEGSEQTVSLSEGGVSFVTDGPIAAGTLVALRITLLPSYSVIAVYGLVTGTEPSSSGETHGVQFVDLEDADRQILARHVMQVQMAARRLRT